MCLLKMSKKGRASLYSSRDRNHFYTKPINVIGWQMFDSKAVKVSSVCFIEA